MTPMRRTAPWVAVVVAAITLTGCSGSPDRNAPSPTSTRDAFCSSWAGAQQAVQDAQQALQGGNPLGLPGALQALQSNLSQLTQSVPADAPAEVRRTLQTVGSRVSDAVSGVLSGDRTPEQAAREIRAIPQDLQRVGEYARSIC